MATKLSNDELLEAFKEMTLIELSEFVKLFEGFDAVGSWGWLRVEVPAGLVKPPENHKCGLSRVRPRRLVTS
jgi:hypothetical protein